MNEEEQQEDRLVDLPPSLEDKIAEYTAIKMALAELRRDVKKLDEEEKMLKEQILDAFDLDDDVENVDKFTVMHNTIPVLHVSVFPRAIIDPTYLKQFYPEIYTKCLKVSRSTRVTVT